MDADTRADERADRKTRKPGTFDSERAREAAKASAAARRAKREGLKEGDATPDAVMAALERKALQGDANAARELRAWRNEERSRNLDDSIDALQRGDVELLLARLLKELGEESPAT